MLILVVGPDPLAANVICATLQAGGYEVVHELDIEAARASLAESKFSLALLVCGAPASNCLRQCQACLEHCQMLEHALRLPTIIMGRTNSTEIKTQARQAGAVDYIAWPVEPTELLARVGAVLRWTAKGPGWGPRREIAPGIELDTRRQAVIVQGQEKLLSAVEFKLLYFLAEHPGRVCSREELLDAVWGWDQAIGSREVDVYVCRVREKIKDDSRAPRHIHTIRGVGYRFER